MLEARTVTLLNNEIALQKQLAKKKDDRTDDKLVTISLTDAKLLEQFYSTDATLKQKSVGQARIMSLIKEAEHWDKTEIERKWFHF